MSSEDKKYAAYLRDPETGRYDVVIRQPGEKDKTIAAGLSLLEAATKAKEFNHKKLAA